MAVKKIIGFTTIREWLLAELDKVARSNKTLKQKDASARRLGKTALKNLWVKTADRRPVKDADEFYTPSDEQITAATHNRYVTRLRRDIEEAGVIGFGFNDDLKALKKAHPKQVKNLKDIDTKTYRTIEKSIKLLIRKARLGLNKSKKETTRKQYDNYIKALKSLYQTNPIMLTLVRTNKERENMSKREENRKRKYQKKPRNFSGIKLIDTCSLLLRSGDWRDLAIGIAISTGRRCGEVLYYGQFSEGAKGKIKFKGLRKSKVKTLNEYQIPALVDHEMIFNAITTLRESGRITALVKRLDGLKLHDAEYSRRLESAVSGPLNTRMNEVFNPETKKDVRWMFKDSRALYARTNYAIYQANSKKANRAPMQEVEYFRSVLLHTDMNETLSYMQFRLSDGDKLNAYQIKKAKEKGENLKFKDRLPLLVELAAKDMITDSRAFTKYLKWTIEKIKAEPDTVIDTALMRTKKEEGGVGGKAATLGAFVKLLRSLKLDAPNLMIVKSKEKPKPKIIKKLVTVNITLTFTEEVEIECVEGEEDDERIFIDTAVDDCIYSLDACDNTDMNYSVENIDTVD